MKLNLKILTVMIASFFMLSACSSSYVVYSNKNVEIQAPADYVDVTDPSNSDILYLVKFSDPDNEATYGGFHSILSIDNVQDNLLHSNKEHIEMKMPVDVLENRLRSIEEDTLSNPSFGWTDFEIVNDPIAIDFKGFSGAMAEFSVLETSEEMDLIFPKRIRRYVIFLEDDLWNIVLAPSNEQLYKREIIEFEKMLESLEIK